jgi:DDE superfamily endonuclease
MRALMLDECHLLWGNILGYVWGKTSERIEVPILNTRTRQTYYGAVDYLTGEVFVKGLPKGNSEHTITFLKALLKQFRINACCCSGMEQHIIVLRSYELSSNNSMAVNLNPSGRFTVFALPQMRQSRIRSRTSGCRQKLICVNVTIAVKPLLK